MYKESEIFTDNQSLREDQYALIIMNKQSSVKLFPIDNKENTKKSCVDFLKYQDDLGPTETETAATMLKGACGLWGLNCPTDIDKQAADGYKFNKVVDEPIHKQASDQSHNYYALGRHYDISNQRNLEKASEYFNKYWDDFEPAQRRTFASNIKYRCGELGVEASDLIQKYSAHTYNPNLPVELALRKKAAPEPIAHKYDLLGKEASNLSVEEFSDLLERLDKQAEIDDLWNRSGISDPLTATVGFEKKSQYIEIDGDEVEKDKLLDYLESNDAKTLLGDSTVTTLKNNLETIESLPTPYKDVIKENVR